MDFGEAIKCWGTALVGYSCLYLLLLSPPVCLMSLSMEMSLFLSWLVGSLGRTLYVLVSCNRACALLV